MNTGGSGPRMPLPWWCWLISSMALTGCPSTTLYRSADPVPKGQWRVQGAGGFGAMADREQQTRFPTLQLELAGRHGVTDNLDLGAKLYLVGTEFNATWRLHQGAWSYALAPSVSGLRAAETGVVVDSIHVFAQLAGIASRRLSKRWTLSMGPSTGWGLYWPETGGGTAQGLWLGAFVQGELRIGRRWRLSPELSTYRVFAGDVPVRGGAITLGAGFARDL